MGDNPHPPHPRQTKRDSSQQWLQQCYHNVSVLKVCFNSFNWLRRKANSPIVKVYGPLGPSPMSIKHNSGCGCNKVCRHLHACVSVCYSKKGKKPSAMQHACIAFYGPTLQSHDSSIPPAVFTLVGWSLEYCSVTEPFITSKVQGKNLCGVFQLVRHLDEPTIPKPLIAWVIL